MQGKKTIGQLFRETRENKEISLSQAAAATRIKIQHIESMETDDFSRIAAATYARGFIKIYAEYLELDYEPLTQQYTELHAPQEVTSILLDEPTQAQQEGKESDHADTTWMDLSSPSRVVRRVLIPVGAIVGAVVAVAAITKSLQENEDASDGELLPSEKMVDPLLGNPPNVYLNLDRSDNR